MKKVNWSAIKTFNDYSSMERPDNIGQPTNQISHADLLFFVIASCLHDSSARGMGPLRAKPTWQLSDGQQ